MGKFRAEILIKESESVINSIPFEFDTIQDLSTRTMATNNPTQPVFDVFANQGLLVLKDKDLNLYNNAINGVFDNAYQFEVLLYKGNVLIAKHIINQRPFYDFANKTLTLSLGNSIDNFDNVLYKGFEYPLEPTKIENIQNDILKNIFGVDKYEFETIFNNFVWNDVEASVGYLPEMSSKDALKKTLEATGCSMIERPVERSTDFINFPKFDLIDMLGRETEGKVYKLLPSHTRKSFVPNIILDNRFSNVAVNSSNLYNETSSQTVFNSNKNHIEIKKEIITDDWEAFKSGYVYIEDTDCYAFIKLKGFEKQFYNLKVLESIHQNFNLNTILEVENKSISEIIENNTNPSVSIYAKISKYEYIGRDEFNEELPQSTITKNGSSVVINSFGYPKSLDVNNTNLWQFKEAKYEEFTHINKDKFEKTFEFSTFSEEKNITLSVETIIDVFKEEPIFKIEDNKLKIESSFIVGKKYLELATSTKQPDYEKSWTASEPTLIYQVIYEPISLNITYNGIVKEIKFDKVLQLTTSENNINKLEIEKGNELIQTNLDGTVENSTAQILLKDLYNFYKDGIRTGEIDVIFGDYISTDGTETKDIDTPFEIGDYVIPCKDNQGTPIITKPLYKEYKITENGTTSSSTITLEGKDYYYWTKKIKLPYTKVFIEKINHTTPVYTATANIINNNELEIYCYSNNSKLQMSVSITLTVVENKPVIYKVVDCEITLDGGAGLQRLKLMENPNMILETLPRANERAMFRLKKPRITIEYENDIDLYDLSNEGETSQEMANEGSNDLINL